MTLQELQQIADLLQWARGKTFSQSVFDKIVESQDAVLKEIEKVKNDVAGVRTS